MGNAVEIGLESRFERYSEVMIKALGHASREQAARWYLRGLMLTGERKSVEPMAARVNPDDVESAHQRMHHLVADAPWSDQALLAAVKWCRCSSGTAPATGSSTTPERANRDGTRWALPGNTADNWARPRTAKWR